MEQELCSLEGLLAAESECLYINTHDCFSDNLINFGNIYYCSLESNLLPFLLFISVFLILGFYMLGMAADKYLSGALAGIAEKLHLSETLAGVTLLAFGNGASDVISSLIAANLTATEEGIGISIGNLIGATWFVSIFSFSLITFYSNQNITIIKNAFLRDCIFLALGLTILLICGIYGEVKLVMAINFILLYVVFPNSYGRFTNNQVQSGNGIEENEDEEIEVREEEETTISIHQKFTSDSRDLSLNISEDYISEATPEELKEYEREKVLIQNKENKRQNNRLRKLRGSANYSLWKGRRFLNKRISEAGFRGLGLFGKLLYIFIRLPISILLGLLIPPFDQETWNRTLASLVPISTIPAIFFLFQLMDTLIFEVRAIYIFLIVGGLLSVVIHLKTHQSKAPPYLWIWEIGSLVLSTVYIWQLVNIVVDLMTFLGFILSIPSPLLALTILAIGNSICDLLANLGLVKIGYAQMAITACFAGPLFNLFIGLGSAFIQIYINQGEVKFSIWEKSSLLNVVSCIGLLAAIILLIVLLIRNKFHMSKGMAKMGVAGYFLFIITISALYVFLA